MTIGLALTTLPIGLAFALAAALAKDLKRAWQRALGEAYTTIFRGLPELLTLLLIYYGAQILSRKLAAATGLPIDVNLSPLGGCGRAFAGVWGLCQRSAAGRAAWRRARADRGGAELRHEPRLAFRRVIAPQMLRMALPGLGNNWLSLLKDTSLVSVIALNDLLRMSSVAVERTRRPFEFYAIACVLYLLMTALSTLAIARAEKIAGRGWKGPA